MTAASMGGKNLQMVREVLYSDGVSMGGGGGGNILLDMDHCPRTETYNSIPYCRQNERVR